MKLKQVYYKQNEKFLYEIFEDKECTKKLQYDYFDNRLEGDHWRLYIELKNGDISPLMELGNYALYNCWLYLPYIPSRYDDMPSIHETLESITPDYSKYIPKDYVIMCLNIESFKMACDVFKNHKILLKLEDIFYFYLNLDEMENQAKMEIENKLEELPKKIMLYTEELTSENLDEINKTAKVLKENNVEWVGVFTPFCFVENLYENNPNKPTHFYENYKGLASNLKVFQNINSLTTTNATGLLEPQKSTYLKVLDCKEIFEEYIKN